MSFIPDNVTRGKQVLGVGRKDARICIVGDYTDKIDAAAGKPFAGVAGTVLDSCLQAAGLIRQECYITNLIKTPPSGRVKGFQNNHNAEFVTVNKKGAHKFTQAGLEYRDALFEELRGVEAFVLVAAGPAAWTALTGRATGLTRNRGYVRATSAGMGGPLDGGARKMIATFNPAETVWKNYMNRTVISIDLKKAKYESRWPEIKEPERNLILKYDSLSECLEWINHLKRGKELSLDIEVINYEVACISFSTDVAIGVVVPLTDSWSEEEEVILWREIQELVGTEDVPKILQNGIFDIHFLLTRCGIEVKGPIKDTMIGHSVMFTELPKGLGFLGSIYCGSQPEWKSTVKFDDVKEES